MSPSFNRLIKLALFAAAAVATVGATALEARRPTSAERVIYVGDKAVKITSTTTAAPDAKVADTARPLAVQTELVNTCGRKCVTACNSLSGNLPPITEDCVVIQQAITLFQGNVNPTFIVQPFSTETLTYGTCSYFAQNLSNFLLEVCWTDLRVKGASAGSSCYPPVFPLHSQGLCSSADGIWAIGTGHSAPY